MKPLFGIDVTEDMENEVVNGTELITRTLPKKLQQELDASTNAVEQALEAGRMPRWFRLVRNLCGYFGLIVFVAVISNLGGLGMAKMMKSSPLLIIGGGLALVAWAVMVYFSRKRSVQADEQAREARLTEALDRSMAQAYGTLGVPKNAPNVDVLSFSYRVKEGEIKPFSVMMNTTPYCNLDLRAGRYALLGGPRMRAHHCAFVARCHPHRAKEHLHSHLEQGDRTQGGHLQALSAQGQWRGERILQALPHSRIYL